MSDYLLNIQDITIIYTMIYTIVIHNFILKGTTQGSFPTKLLYLYILKISLIFVSVYLPALFLHPLFLLF